MDKKEFWQAVYIAAIQSGCSTDQSYRKARSAADDLEEWFPEEEEEEEGE